MGIIVNNMDRAYGNIRVKQGGFSLRSRENKDDGKPQKTISLANMSNPAEDKIATARKQARLAVLRAVKNEERLDGKVKVYSDKGDEVGNRIIDIEQDKKNNQKMIDEIAQRYGVDIDGADNQDYRELDRIASYLAAGGMSHDDMDLAYDRTHQLKDWQKEMLPYLESNHDHERDLPSDIETRKKLKEKGIGLDYQLEEIRKGVSDIQLERLGTHTVRDAYGKASEIMAAAADEVIQTAVGDKVEGDKADTEEQIEEAIEKLKEKEREEGNDGDYLDVVKDMGQDLQQVDSAGGLEVAIESAISPILENMSSLTKEIDFKGLIVDDVI